MLAAAFINNLLAIDHSKSKEQEMIFSLLFYGPDATKDTMEAQAVQTFKRVAAVQMMRESGWYHTLVALSQLTGKKWPGLERD